MVTTFLSPEDVRAYLRDLVIRLGRLRPLPGVICAMARSGTTLLNVILDLLPEHAAVLTTNGIRLLAVEVDEAQATVRFSPNEPSSLAGQHVFFLDGAIHSGRTMNRCVQQAYLLGAVGVCTYALVMKRGSGFVPTFWGLMINDADRAYFLLDTLPNNRLEGRVENQSPPYANLRLLQESDTSKPLLKKTVSSMDRATWGDRLFDMRTNPDHKTYVLETAKLSVTEQEQATDREKTGGRIVGYLTISQVELNSIQIDEVAVHPNECGKGYGALLIRFAETLARHSQCDSVRLYSISNRVDFYKGLGYDLAKGDKPIPLDAEQYLAMEKPILHHFPR